MNHPRNGQVRFFVRTRDVKVVENVHWTVSRPMNLLFTGRLKIVERVQNELREGFKQFEQKRIVITGIGGIGKSEVCLRIAYNLRRTFWGVFWVDVSTPSNAQNGFLAIARAMELPGESIEEVLHALANTPHRWLLVLDNADDPHFNYATYIPSSTRSAVIMTSSVPECSRYSTLPVEVLEDLDEEKSTQLLLQAARVPRRLWRSSKEQAQTIVRLIGSHPVALIQAGTFVADGYCQLNQYAEIYKRLCTQPLERCPMQQQPRYQEVYAAFEASFEVLNGRKDERGQDAVELLGVLSMLHFGLLPLMIFPDAWSGAQYVLQHEDAQLDNLGPWHVSNLPGFIYRQAELWSSCRLHEASTLLASLSLVTKQGVDRRVGLLMDPLVHAWSKIQLSQKQRQAAWVHAGCILTLSRNQSNMWQIHETQLRSHVHSLLEPSVAEVFSFGPPDMILPILLECGWILDASGGTDKLGLLLKEIYGILDISPSNASQEHMRIWDLAVNNMLDAEHSGQARGLLEQVVKIKSFTLADNHPSLLASQYMLADLYLDDTEKKEAIRLLESIVKVEPTPGEDYYLRLAPQQALAFAYLTKGRIEEGVALLEDGVKSMKTIFAQFHSQLALEHAFADIYRTNLYIWKTIRLLRQPLAIRALTMTKDHTLIPVREHARTIAYQIAKQAQKALKVQEYRMKIKMTATTSQHALAYACRASRRAKETAELLDALSDVCDSTDLASVLSLDMPPSLTSGTTISDASGIAENAAQQFFEILINDDVMQHLFPVFIEKAGLEKFKRNFLRLLTRYAIDLKAEAKGHIQAGAAQLVGSRANYIVHLIAEGIEPNEVLALPETGISETDKEQILEYYLQGQYQQTQKHHESDFSSFDPQSSDLYSEKLIDEGEEVIEGHEIDEDDEVDEPGKPTLTNLDEVKRFMVQSEAYKVLRASFHHYVFPVEEVINTESQPNSTTVNAVNTSYRLHWTCTCGHKGYDNFEETIPGAVTKLAQLFQANGIQSYVEPEPSNSGTFKLHRSYLAIRNMVNRHIKAVGSFLHIVSRPHTSQPATSVSTGIPGSTKSLPATSGGQTTAQSTHPVTNVVSQSSNVPRITQTTATQCQKPTSTSRNDYMLLCAHDQRWLATREDLDVAQIKSDRELFDSFQNRMNKRRSQMSRVFSLKTVQSISFVKFALRQDQEVDLLEPNEIPPPIEQHYDFNERNPGRIPPIGNDYLMHRFSNSVHCRDSTFCLDQIPKRTGCRPQIGYKPDGFTGWGLYFEESLDMFRFCLWGMAMFLVSLIFGVAWAASKQSVQDGFAVASYILAFEAFTMGTVQAAIAFKMI